MRLFTIYLTVFIIFSSPNILAKAADENDKKHLSRMKYAELCMDRGGTWVGSIAEGHCDHNAKKELEIAEKCIDEGKTWHGSFKKGYCGN